MQKYDGPKYHIIRCNRNYTDSSTEPSTVVERLKKVMQNINYVFQKFFLKKGDDYDFKDMTEETYRVQDLLENEPERHTFVFIKDTTKCAVTISKKFLGVVYERWTENSRVFKQRNYFHRQMIVKSGKPQPFKDINALKTTISRESFIVQSLAGRLTGYCSESLITSMTQTVVFTDPMFIHSHIRDTYNHYFGMSNPSSMIDSYLHIERYMDPLPHSGYSTIKDSMIQEQEKVVYEFHQHVQELKREDKAAEPGDIPEYEYPEIPEKLLHQQLVVWEGENEEELGFLTGLGTAEYEHDGDPSEEPEYEPVEIEGMVDLPRQVTPVHEPRAAEEPPSSEQQIRSPNAQTGGAEEALLDKYKVRFLHI